MVRGTLCGPCNKALHRQHDAAWHERAIAYLLRLDTEFAYGDYWSELNKRLHAARRSRQTPEQRRHNLDRDAAHQKQEGRLCEAPACERRGVGKLCPKHLYRWRRYGSFDPPASLDPETMAARRQALLERWAQPEAREKFREKMAEMWDPEKREAMSKKMAEIAAAPEVRAKLDEARRKRWKDQPEPPHGSGARYQRGCRCEFCRAGIALQVRANVARREAEGVAVQHRTPDPEHGTCARYARGCRCDDCKKAMADRMWAKRHPDDVPSAGR